MGGKGKLRRWGRRLLGGGNRGGGGDGGEDEESDPKGFLIVARDDFLKLGEGRGLLFREGHGFFRGDGGGFDGTGGDA